MVFFQQFFWAIATLLANKWGATFDTWVLSAYQMLFGGLLLLLASFSFEKAIFHFQWPVLIHFILVKYDVLNCSICDLVLSSAKR